MELMASSDLDLVKVFSALPLKKTGAPRAVRSISNAEH